MMTGPNTGLGSNSMIVMIEAQIKYIVEAIQLLKKTKSELLEVKEEALKEFNKEIQMRHESAVWATGCKTRICNWKFPFMGTK